MKIADFVILAVVIIALAIALWYNHKDKKNSCGGCCGSCSGCTDKCSQNQKKRGYNSNEN